MTELPGGWVLEPLTKHIASKSGDSKIIKGKQSSQPRVGLVQGFSASGPDVWVPEAQYNGQGIIVSAVGARCGKTFQANGAWTAIANTHVLVPSAECGIDFKWLWYLTNDEDFWIRSGTAQPFVKVKDTLLRPQLIPPLEEQKRIVETLDDHLSRLDKALAETQNAATKATTYWHSMLHSLLFRNDSGELASTVQLGSLAELVMGQAPAGSDCNKNGVGTPFVKVGEFGTSSPEIREWTTKPLKMASSSDVLICVVGATIGKLNLGIECAIGRSVAAIRPGLKLRQKYLYYFLQTKVLEIRASSKGSAQGVITRQQLLEMQIPALSLDAQDWVIESLETARRSLDVALSDLNKVSSSTSTLRRSVLNAAFTGNLRTTGNEIQ
jgi:restriction endonuclease S subunit